MREMCNSNSKMDNENVSFYIECIRNLLIGLDIQQIDLFMSRLTPENCHKLGLAYAMAVKSKLEDIELMAEQEKTSHK